MVKVAVVLVAVALAECLEMGNRQQCHGGHAHRGKNAFGIYRPSEPADRGWSMIAAARRTARLARPP